MSESNTPPAPRTGSLLVSALVGLLLGAGFGAVEMALRAGARMEPSVARRVPDLLLYAACMYGLAGLTLGLLAHLVARRSRRPRSAAFAVPVAGVALVAALLYAGKRFWESSEGVRLMSLSGCLAGALVLAGLLACLLPERWLPRFVKPASLAALGLASLVIASIAALATARGEDSEPFATERGDAVPGAPNILFVLVDTLRADVLGTYGDSGGLTPSIDALAARGVVFERTLAPTSWTLPAMASLFTSRDPALHGMVDFNKRVPSDLDSLPKALGRAGYDRRAFVSNGLVNMDRGFSQGFEYFDIYNFDLESHLFLSNALTRTLRLSDVLGFSGRARNPVLWLNRARFPWLTTRLSFDPDDQILTDRVLAHVSDRDPDAAPLFLYVHYGAPHSPYTEHPQGLLPSQPELEAGHHDELWQRYRNEVSWTDAAFGRLLEGLREQGLLDDALIVFTADHGEEFLEHGRWEHGRGLYNEVLRVPWIMAGPGATPGTRVSERVQLTDLAPTLLSWAGLPASDDFMGRDHTRALASGAVEPTDLPVFGELTSRFLNPDHNWVSATQGRWKVIRKRDVVGELVGEELFDLEADPLELAPLEAHPPEVAGLFEALDRYESLMAAGEDGEVSAEMLENMKALGYLGDDPQDRDE